MRYPIRDTSNPYRLRRKQKGRERLWDVPWSLFSARNWSTRLAEVKSRSFSRSHLFLRESESQGCRTTERGALAAGGPRPADHGRDEHGEGCEIDAHS
jgi:hypothetical protein